MQNDSNSAEIKIEDSIIIVIAILKIFGYETTFPK